MHHSFGFRLSALCRVATGMVASSFGPAGSANLPNEATPAPTVYHADAKHLWNRLHAALLVRSGLDGRLLGIDRFEPLLWPGSKHLLEKQSHERLRAVLEEFAAGKGEQRMNDPLKRPILQRDLWLVFNWLEGVHTNFEEPYPPPGAV